MGDQVGGSLARRFRELRTRAGLTKTDLARPRYTVSYVSQIEAGRRTPSPEAMAFFAARLGVSASYLATGIPEDAEPRLGYLLEEANRARRAGRHAEAEEATRSVLAEAEGYGLARLRARALVALGDALASQGRMREAIDRYEEALEGDLPEPQAGLAVAALAKAYRSVGDLAYAAELAESHLARSSGRPQDPGVVAELQALLVSVSFERGDMVRAERAARYALAAAEAGASPEARATAYWNASRVAAELRRWDEALDLASRARTLLEEADDRRRLARIHNAYAFICLEREPPLLEAAREHLDRAEALLTEVGAPDDLAYVLTERSRLALLERRPGDALEHARRARAQTLHDELEVARARFLEGRALAALGKARPAREALREAAALFEKQGARQQQAACWRELGELDLAEGDVEAAVEALRAGLAALDPRRSRA